MAFDAARQRIVMFPSTWQYGDLVPASSASFGSGCAAAHGVPVLGTDLPWVGNSTFTLQLIANAANAPAALGLSAATQASSLGGCTFYLGNPWVGLPVVTGATGIASVAIPVPNAPALRGGAVYLQGLVLDPPGEFAGIALSAALRLVIGD